MFTKMNGKIKLDVNGNATFTAEAWEDGWDVVTTLKESVTGEKNVTLTDDSVIGGKLSVPVACKSEVEKVNDKFGNLVETNPNLVQFEDKEVLRVLNEKAIHSNAAGFTEAELGNITDIQTWFSNNGNIRSFNELAKTSVKNLVKNTFYKCRNLKYIDVSNIEEINKNGHSSNSRPFDQSGVEVLNFSKVTKTTASSRSNEYSMLGNIPEIKAIFFPNVEIHTNYSNDNPALRAVACLAYNEISRFKKFRVLDFGKKIKTIESAFDTKNYNDGKCFTNGCLIFRSPSIPTISLDILPFEDSIKFLFVPASLINAYQTNEFMSKFSNRTFAIGSKEWCDFMGMCAADEGYTKPDNIGWDYEYIDYLIYGVEPPTE